MPEARDRLSRPNNEIAEMYIYGQTSIGSIGILPDNHDINRTPFRWGATPLTGGGSPMGEAHITRTTAGRGLFGTPRTVHRRGRGQNTPPAGSSFRRGRGGRSGQRSALPSWYPRTPLGDITYVVRAIESRKRGDEGQLLGSPTPVRMGNQQDPSPLRAQEVTPEPKFPFYQWGNESELLTPQKLLLNSIEIVERVVVEELNRMKRTPSAKRAEWEKRVKTLMSMR